MTGLKKQQLFCKISAPAMLLIAGGIAYAHYYPTYIKPCSKPVEYSLGQFDSRFQISDADFLQAVSEAEAVWETPASQNLFEYSPTGTMKMNLVYDYRQEASDRLKSLGYKIENTQDSYNNLKSHYDTLLASYNNGKKNLDSMVAQFEPRKAKYDDQVDYWNRQGGAPKDQVAALNAERNALTQLVEQIQQQQQTVNNSAADVNGLVEILNNLRSQMNINVASYNTIGSSRGDEFEEGVYAQDGSGKSISIYEFTDHAELVRVLAHELGHALGLQHVEDPQAIMYRLNQSANEKATEADTAELQRICGI